MKAINRFLAGIKEFKSPDLYKGNEWCFPSSGVRIMDYKNKGLSVVFHKGNTGEITAELSNGEAFKLPYGFTPIGNVTYNGVIYISSVADNGLCSIGSYPSPNWDSPITGFERNYKVLKNFTTNGATRIDLTTKKFNFSDINQVDMIAKKKFDGTVDLYLADFHNPNRVINTGFTQIGYILNTLIHENEFNGSNSLIPTTLKYINPELGSVINGGTLEFGMYHIYFRYKTGSKTTTKFVGKVFPIQIGKGDTSKTVMGSYELTYDDVIALSNKMIKIDISGIDFDSGFESIEIAVVRYSSDTGNALIRDTYLIDKEYLISTLGNEIIIDGREPRMTFAFEEVIMSSNTFSTCKDQTIVDSRYYGSRWKGIEYDRRIISEFCSKIQVGYTLSNEIPDTPKYESSNEDIYQHQNEMITYSNTGFFRGETYPFTAKLLLTNGSFTEPFPLEGCYEYIPGTRSAINQKGVYTFPSHGENAVHNQVNNRHKSLGVKFTMNDAITFMNSNLGYFNNIKGIVFMRGDRIENLLYQGIGSDVIKGVVSKVGKYGDNNNGSSEVDFEFEENKKIPWPFNKLGFYTGGGRIDSSDVGRKYEEYNVIGEILSDGVIIAPKHKAVFSPDYLFEANSKLSIGEDVVTKRIIKYTQWNNQGKYNWDSSNNEERINDRLFTEYGHSLNSNEVSIHFDPSNSLSGKGYLIDDAVHNGLENMCSIVDQFNSAQQLFEYNLYLFNSGNPYQDTSSAVCSKDNPENCTSRVAGNASMRLARFIAISFNNDITESFNDHIINVYKNEPSIALYNSIIDTFNPGSTLYYDISDIKELTNSIFTTFKGDCFLQRIAFRLYNTYNLKDGWEEEDVWSTVRNHFYPNGSTKKGLKNAGSIMSAIVESRINGAMRNVVEGKTSTGTLVNYRFYPDVLAGYDVKHWIGSFDLDENKYEGCYVNSGYNKVSSDSKAVGFSVGAKYGSNERPTRIYFSPKAKAGEIADKFRMISPIAFQDYPLENGAITAIANVNDTLISIQENAINQHQLGQQKLTNTASDIVLNNTGMYLSDKVRQLAQYGSQHQWSVLSIGNNIFGVDLYKRVIWVVGTGQTDSGQTSYNSTNLSEKKQVFGWLKKLVDDNSYDTDVLDFVKDNPINGEGVNVGFDRRYKEVVFGFHFKQVVENAFPLSSVTTWISDAIAFFGELRILTDGDSEITYLYYWNDNYVAATSSDIPDPTGASHNSWIRCGDINGNLTIYSEENMRYAKSGDIVNIYNGNSGHAYIVTSDYPQSRSDLYIYKSICFECDPIVTNRISITRTVTFVRESLVYDALNMVFTGTGLHNSGMYFELGENMFSANEYNIDNDKRNSVFLHNNKSSKVGEYYGEMRESKLSFIVSGDEKVREMIKMFLNYSIDTDNIPFKSIEFFTDYQSSKLDPFIPIDPNLFYLKPEYLENMWRGPISGNQDSNPLYQMLSEMRGEYLKVTLTYNQEQEKSIRKFITDHIISYI